jgi:hypothetical protein
MDRDKGATARRTKRETTSKTKKGHDKDKTYRQRGQQGQKGDGKEDKKAGDNQGKKGP